LAGAILYFGYLAAATPISIRTAVAAGMADWFLWAAYVPLIVWLARRVPIRRERLLPGILFHLCASAALALFDNVILAFIYPTFGVPRSFPSYWQTVITMAATWLPTNLLTYWVIVAGTNALALARRLSREEVRAATLRAALSQAQLRALRMQLHPHFLFNTLHTIAAFARDRLVDRSVDMIANLADLLRASLEHEGSDEVTLKEEMDFIQKYLDIEQSRFGDRLCVRTEIASDTLAAQVPTMILQPIVENAIRHGIATHPGPGVIEISSRRHNGVLQLRVRDDGPGFGRSFNGSDRGLGIQNTAARLAYLYGDAQRLEIRDHEEGGAVVDLAIPWHTEPLSIEPE
jgi:signal transduction histidine kinase